VSKWEDGTAAPNRNRVQAVAKALGLKANDLSSHSAITISSVDLIKSGASIPVMDWSLFVQYPGGVPEAVLSTLPTVLADVEAPQQAVALRIEDDPMPGHLSSTDVVIVDQSINPVNGDLVVALAGGDIVVRQYQDRGLDSKGAPCFDLLSTNQDLPTRTVNSSNAGKVLGVIVEVRKRRR
jgi:SOS-response transcriptional repressor LexA